MSRVLVINTGSSSIKYQLFEMDGQKVLASGLVERIGEAGSRLTHRAGDAEPLVVEDRVADHSEGFERVFQAFDPAGEPIGDLTVRMRDIFRLVVEAYLDRGLPVGSKALAGAVSLSPASIRGVSRTCRRRSPPARERPSPSAARRSRPARRPVRKRSRRA